MNQMTLRRSVTFRENVGKSGFQELRLSRSGSKIFLLLPACQLTLSKMGRAAAAKNCSLSGQNYKAWKGPM